MRKSMHILVILAGFAAVASPLTAVARPPRGPVEVRRPPAPGTDDRPGPKLVLRLPSGYTRVVHAGVEYYLRDGVFYKRTASGYIVVPGPVGVQVDMIPDVALKVRVGAVELYYHYGTYYRYDPAARVYVVVKPEKEPARDVVVLVDGQTYTGEYLGGNERCIDLQVGEEVLEIGVRDIVSITFSPREYAEEGE